MIAALPLGAAHCLEVFWRAAAPRTALSVSQWADQHRELSGKQAGERGRWRTSRTPFLREIMDCLSATSRVTDIVVMKSSQVGVTEATVNWLGYIFDHAPAPAMVMMPTIESRDAWKVQKLNPLLQETPAVREVLGGVRSRDAANRQDLIDFPGGVLFLAGGNSANSYAQKSVRYLILDDLDRFPMEVGSEGDVIMLARGRTKAFPRAKRLFISTPTVKGESLIEREWLKSDMRRYHVACPHCGERQPLIWGQLKFGEHAREAWYVCPHCGAEIYEHQKPALLSGGTWIAEYPGRPIRGYHLSALYAPIGLGPSWRDLAAEWQHAVKNPATLRTFINTHLGETWEEQGDSIDPIGLITRLEDYPEPMPARPRTVGVDVQKDRVEYTVIDWAEGEEAWVREHGIVPGDTAEPHVWEQLGEELAEWAPDFAALDEGYNTSMVRAFAAKRAWCITTKGQHGPGHPLVEENPKKRRARRRTKRKAGPSPEPLGVDQGKALLFARAKTLKPGPGYIHWPNDPAFDDEYFAQLAAEKLVTEIRGLRPVAVWKQIRPRNEALDCWILALAALRAWRIDHGGANWKAKGEHARDPAPKEVPRKQAAAMSIDDMIAAARARLGG